MSSHKALKFLKDHQVISLEDVKSGQVNLQSVLNKKPTCSHHEGQPLSFFCESCGVLACRDCTVVNHTGPEHVCVELSRAIKKQKLEIQHLVEDSDAVVNQVNDALDTTIATRRSLDANAKQALEDIKKAEERAIAQIHKIFHAEQDQLDEYVNDAHTEIYSAEERLRSQQAQLKRAQEMANQVLTTGSDYDVASVFQQLKTSLRCVCDERPITLDAGVDDVTYGTDQANPISTQNFGRLTLGTKWVPTKEFGQKGPIKLCHARHIATTPSGDIAVANLELIEFD